MTSPAVATALERVAAGRPLDRAAAGALIEAPADGLGAIAGGGGRHARRRQGPHRHVLAEGLPAAHQPLPRPLRLLHVPARPGRPGRVDDDARRGRSPWSRGGRALGCIEALLCLGDKPEAAFPALPRPLAALGHATHGRLRACAPCEIALDARPAAAHQRRHPDASARWRACRTVNVEPRAHARERQRRGCASAGRSHQRAPDKAPAPCACGCSSEAGRAADPVHDRAS